MAVPKGKKSKAKRDSRRANHDRISLPHISICNHCGADVLHHRVCAECGWYSDRVAVEIKAQEEEDDDMEDEG